MISTKSGGVTVWRFFLWALAGGLLVFLFWKNLVPTGILRLSYEKGNPNSPISDLHPEKRVIDLPHPEYAMLTKNAQQFYIDPVYFDVRVPRSFNDVSVDLMWHNTSQPILELGARKARGLWSFVLKPLQNLYIDTLNWECMRSQEITFCQKEHRYNSLSDFFAEPPSSGVLTYHYSVSEAITATPFTIDTTMDDYNFFLTTYTPPEPLGNGWYRRTVNYTWNDFSVYINEISFLISAPALDKHGGDVALGDIAITLKREQLTAAGLWEYAKEQLRRLK